MRKNLAFVLALILALSVFAVPAGAEGPYTPGTYEASVQGMGGPVKVTMTFSENAILSVEASGELETKGLGDAAIEKLKDAVMEKQTAEVDSVAGATVSSTAMLAAPRSASAWPKERRTPKRLWSKKPLT